MSFKVGSECGSREIRAVPVSSMGGREEAGRAREEGEEERRKGLRGRRSRWEERKGRKGRSEVTKKYET